MWLARMAAPTAALILLVAAGCAAPDPASAPSSAPSSAATPVAIILKKGGGIAGVNETLTVEPTGKWRRSSRTGARLGTLSPEQVARLATLAADPRLAAEATRPKSPGNCADAFTYEVTVQSTTVMYSDCGSEGQQTATAALVQFLEQATAG